MKKIVFSDLPMKKQLFDLRYRVDGNKALEYDGVVAFPINAVLARTLKKEDDVKIVLLSKTDVEGNSAVNAGLFQKELNAINEKIGAHIEYVTITTPFIETREVHEKLFRDMAAKLEDGAQIIADITYGPKPLPIIMFSVLNFAEKFFGSEIKYIVYGKVDFVSGEKVPQNPIIFDLSPLYYLNNLTNTMEFSSSKEALKALDEIIDF